jgi:hypothetical protein
MKYVGFVYLINRHSTLQEKKEKKEKKKKNKD